MTYISDGDTFHLITASGEKHKIRVEGIDCPETSQAFGLEAKEFVMKEIKGHEITVRTSTTDRYGRLIARVLYQNKDLSQELIKNGLAWHYKFFSKDSTLANLEIMEREKKAGLLQSKNPIAPWEYGKYSTQ
ncbi:thermonuclease family protein [Xanthovirga aplysinae]|uniref:thermonuclease family protein n=1 Tax=Xanthovirga aplysinae TaxID=2529853 RepID=UPI00165751BF